ncbi:hypothetical protein ACTXT7_011826 [Hymenolepis weldensis]
MKLAFIILSYLTCYLMYIKFKTTYNKDDDTFQVLYLLIPSALLALLINHNFTTIESHGLEVLWTFSIYLEAVAILPQLFMISKTGEAETITAHYLFALGSYRALYIFNWIYRYVNEDTYELIAIVAGTVQTVLYVDFFYLYVTRVEPDPKSMKNKKWHFAKWKCICGRPQTKLRVYEQMKFSSGFRLPLVQYFDAKDMRNSQY